MNGILSQTADYKKLSLLLLLLFISNLFMPPATRACGPNYDEVIIICPNDLTVEAEPGLCGIILDFNSLEWLATVPLVDTIFTPGPGFFFFIGTTPITLMGTDTNGMVSVCAFNLTVDEYPGMSCQDTVLVNLDEDCSVPLNYETTLIPNEYGCPITGLTVNLLSPSGEPLGHVVTTEFLGHWWDFTVTNSSGNSCSGLVFVPPNGAPPAITCPADTTIFCNEPTAPAFLGLPEITGCLDESLLGISFEDLLLSSFCNGDTLAFRMERAWEAVDTFGVVTSCIQNIYARRLDLSDLVFPPNFDGVENPAIACTPQSPIEEQTDPGITGVPLAHGLLPQTLACYIDVSYFDQYVPGCGASFTIEREWTVFDQCQNTFVTKIQTIEVVDNQPALFTVPDTIFVSTNSECGNFTTFPPINLVHECSGIVVSIVTPWGTLNSNGGEIPVPLQPAQYDIFYNVEDECNNDTSVHSLMFVTTELINNCPPQASVSCDVYFDEIEGPLQIGDLSVLAPFGYPATSANCGIQMVEEASASVDACGNGNIVRIFTGSFAGQNLSCEQTVEVVHVSNFEVLFPADTLVVCDVAPFDAGSPQLFFVDCEMMEVSSTDSVITNEPGSCYKILRTWMVANTCVTGDTLEDLLPDPMVGERRFGDGGDGYIVYQQSIEIVDQTAPQFPDTCVLPDICIASGCDLSVTIPDPNILECAGYTVTAAGDLGAGTGPFPSTAPGTYGVTFTVTDNCNNQSSCTTTLTVVDCVAPQAVCQNGINVQLQNTNPASAWFMASQVNALSMDNCTGPLLFSFSENVNDDSLQLTCDQAGIFPVQLWVTDAAGNQDFCQTNIFVESPPGNPCTTTLPEVTGSILTETGTGIAQVQVSNGAGQTVTTGANGQYTLPNPGTGFTITPLKNINTANGVTTFDAVLLTKHILGNAFLNSPYKIIAADANHSNTVTTLDAVEMRKIILGITTNFPNNTSWRFVPVSYVFPNPGNPWFTPFPEVVVIGNPMSLPNLNFIGIKIGDLNLSANPLNLASIDSRNFTGDISFALPGGYMHEGAVVRLPFDPGTTPLHGFQFALQFDPELAEFIALEPGFAGPECFGTAHLPAGKLSVSWYAGEPYRPTAGQPAFTLVFRAKKDGFAGQALLIDEREMPAEAYTDDLSFLRVSLSFGENSGSTGGILAHAVRPNPFRESTAIAFTLAGEERVMLTILDPAGRQVFGSTTPFEAGGYEIILNREDFSGPGLYIYKLETESGIATGKLLLF
jgi:hypothetical protein